MTEKKKASPWMWIGCGCGLVLLVIAIAVAAVGVFAAKAAKDFGETMADPLARDKKAIEILGGEELPPGFHSMVGLSVPWVFDLVLLSDLPAEDGGEPQDFGDAGFIYLQLRRGMGTSVKEIRDYFDGTSDDVSVLRENNINIRVDEILDRGRVQRIDLDLMWVAQRGGVRSMGNSSKDTLTAMMLLDCPQDKKLRLAIWFENQDWDDEDTSEGTEERNYSGTPADPTEIEQFAQYLRPCPAN